MSNDYFHKYPHIILARIVKTQNEFVRIIQTKIEEHPERTTYLMENLKLKNNTPEQIDEIQKMVPGTTPIYTRQYKIPQAQLQEVEKQLLELEQKGIIEKSNSAWNSPLLMVKKHSDDPIKQEWRLFIDYKRLNAVTIPEQFPIPEISTIIENLGGGGVKNIHNTRSSRSLPSGKTCSRVQRIHELLYELAKIPIYFHSFWSNGVTLHMAKNNPYSIGGANRQRSLLLYG